MSATSHRRIVIGDVHGHYQGLMQLLEAIAPVAEDQVYFLGDLIDRGPQSSQVVDFVKNNSYPCLLGNHEHMLVKILTDKKTSTPSVQGWLYSGGQATLASYGTGKIPQEHLEWFQSLPLYLDLGDIFLVHAGVDPTKTIEEQSAEQFCWIRDQFHSIKKPYFSDKVIIVGHTITFTFPEIPPGKIARGAGWLDLDTGAYHPRSGWLSAFDVTNRLVYQVNVFKHSVRTLPIEEASAKVNFYSAKVSRNSSSLWA
ncbi:metallophosphoesterase family protein [Rivularia sp. UHCC 0363]|uniref:metallophosphoesterase family protein n=1 Tax=Rivularia sp. UHCC 0363 TaxID=3110244 RepID=UPI002B1EA908|nr:metallophosphoesterase family protein [Rivularia sp. UHCC 0363]MEA5597817.1 metallophosphoesterase family protein [Rivularia sp. UHCC 0363]